MNPKQKQLGLFIIFSASAGIIQLVVFTILFEWAQSPYWISYSLSLVTMMTWNTAFNRKYTFQSDILFRTAIVKLLLFYQICSRKLLLQAQRDKWGMNGTAFLVQKT